MKLFPYSVECKNCERWSIPEWIEQAKGNKYQDTDWLLVVKKNRGTPLVVMDADTFFRMASLQSEAIREDER